MLEFPTSPLTRVDLYRRRAEECLALADLATTEVTKSALLQLAKNYLILAEHELDTPKHAAE